MARDRERERERGWGGGGGDLPYTHRHSLFQIGVRPYHRCT